MNLFKIITAKEKIHIYLILLLLLVTAFFSFLPIVFMEKYINSVVKSTSIILILGGGYLILQLVNTGLGTIVNYIIRKQQIQIASSIQQRLFDIYVSMNYENIFSIDSADITNALLEDVNIISEKYLLPIANIILSLATFVIGVIYIVRINYILASVIVPLGFITAILNWVSEKKYMQNGIEKKELSVSLWKSFSEIFKGIVPIRIYNREDDYKKLVNTQIEKYKMISNKQNLLEKINSFIANFLFMFSIGVILIVAGILTANNQMSIGGMVAILMYNHMIIDPLVQLIETKKLSVEVQTSVDRLHSFLNTAVRSSVNVRGECDEIVIQNLSFSYKSNNENKDVLKNINMHIKNKQKIAIFGPSGIGKTTFVKLIAGFYNLESTAISYYLNKQKQTYFPTISYLYQNSYLFDDSIINNIKLSNPLAGKTEIDTVINICLLDDVVKRHKDFNIGENGDNLSGGEKTRLRLAIAILKSDASIYIFDEISTSLDSQTFEKILNNLMPYMKNKICIFIEHNSLIKPFMDKVYTLSDGELKDG